MAGDKASCADVIFFSFTTHFPVFTALSCRYRILLFKSATKHKWFPGSDTGRDAVLCYTTCILY